MQWLNCSCKLVCAAYKGFHTTLTVAVGVGVPFGRVLPISNMIFKPLYTFLAVVFVCQLLHSGEHILGAAEHIALVKRSRCKRPTEMHCWELIAITELSSSSTWKDIYAEQC